MDGDTYGFAYNGLGDRLQQTVNGVPQNYTLDIVASLTQVLANGTDAYMYGVGRIGQDVPGWQYHLGDALASVRQLTDRLDMIGLAQAFEPFGALSSRAGLASTLWIRGRVDRRDRSAPSEGGRPVLPCPGTLRSARSYQRPSRPSVDPALVHLRTQQPGSLRRSQRSGCHGRSGGRPRSGLPWRGRRVQRVGIALGGVYGALTYDWALGESVVARFNSRR